MTCNCNEKPCGCNKCDDEGEILQLTPLQSEECDCGGCSPCSSCGTKTGCNCQIESTNDCLTVETTECGIVKLTAKCQKPVVGDNITAKVDETPDEFIVHSICKDEKVKVADCGDAGFLEDLVTAGEGIIIDTSCNNLEISVDKKIIPSVKHPDIVIHDSSNLISARAVGHDIWIDDIGAKYYYGKWTLLTSATETRTAGIVGDSLEDVTTWKNASRYPVSTKLGFPSFNSQCDMTVPGEIKIERTGLYHVGFSGSAEVNYGVHAFRIQMYRVPAGVQKKKGKTILESRYSGPLGYSLANAKFNNTSSMTYVKTVDFDSESFTKGTYNDAFPLIGELTETEGQAGKGGSQSLGAVVDRVPVTGNTIIELNKGDIIYVGGKLSTSVTGDGGEGSLYNDNIVRPIEGHISLLGLNDADGDNGGECGFSFYVNMIHPILNRGTQ